METPKQPIPSSMVKISPISPLEEIIFENEILYITNFTDCFVACTEILCQIDKNAEQGGDTVIGFDAEWPYDPKSGAGKLALIQICFDDIRCYLFHVYYFTNLPETFVQILKHPRVKLTGLNIAGDVEKIGKDFNIDVKFILIENCVELGPLACSILKLKEFWSLDRLVKFLLKKNLNKNTIVRRSKWELTNLTDEQKIYAATDAYVSLLCFQELMRLQN